MLFVQQVHETDNEVGETGMMRDPVDAKTCIRIAGSFDRITELLAQYLHANAKNNMENTDVSVTDNASFKLALIR